MADQELITREEYDRTISGMQRDLAPGAVGRERNRRRVAADILETFDLIGGVSTFTTWAAENQSEFYRMWAKMAPPPDQLDGATQMRVIHVVPRSPLDE